MQIRVNRNRTKPPRRDYTRRSSPEAAKERANAVRLLKSLEPGQSVEFIGPDATRDRMNSLLAILERGGYNTSRFATARTPDGIGVWRVV